MEPLVTLHEVGIFCGQLNIEELKAAVEEGNLTAAAAKAKEALEMADKISLNIAVTGESGSGKSSFVNAIRGLRDTDEGSAETGVIEMTIEPTAYPHPKYPNVKIWDLPGIGTPTFQPDTYLEQVQFSQYDFFIIIASEHFKYNHVTLALEIQRLGKKFYFVRCKPLLYSETAILALIRENCVKNLETAGFPSPQVFLIANPEFGKYDSPKLQDTLIDELPRQKRLTFLRSLPNISKEALEKKKKVLQGQIWLKSIASAAIAAVPIPGLSTACDVAILVASLKGYCKDFGLDEDSLNKLARQTGKPITELKAMIKSPLLDEITKDLVIKLLTKSATGAVKYPLLFLNSIPVIGVVRLKEILSQLYKN
uniref:IRG-type G domain-containing protein n=1 Tax=Pelusios castaneus TaxID=367368 RepID=A0A8C8RHY0_9SAUR